MTFLASLGPLTVDQEVMLPRIDRALDAMVKGSDSAEQAVAAVLAWLRRGEQSGRIEWDFPRREELEAACCVETFKRWIRANNARIYWKYLSDIEDDIVKFARVGNREAGELGSDDRQARPRRVG